MVGDSGAWRRAHGLTDPPSGGLPVLALLLTLLDASGAVAAPRDLSPAERQAVKEAVTSSIKYPGEVKFTWPKYNGTDRLPNHVYCGAVYAKGKVVDYDYYAEYTAMIFTRDDGTPYAVLTKLADGNPPLDMEVVRDTCAQSGYGKLD